MARKRRVGWAVLYIELADRKDRWHCQAASEEQARRLAAELNRRHPGRLYWAEYWNTSSTFDHDQEEAGEAPEEVAA
jgi:hypothetical protein